MASPVAWSYSVLGMFENCPRKYWAIKIAKLVSDANQYNAMGDDSHKAFEEYLKKGLMLPPHWANQQPLLDWAKSIPGEKFYEYQMTLTPEFIPTTWRDFKGAWVRAATDFLSVNGSKAIYLDWKSGKFRPDDDQIELTALMVFRHFPAVEQVNGGLVFFKHNKVHRHIIRKREDEALLWNKFIERVKPLQIAIDTSTFAPNPNPLCAYCPYRACQYNTNKTPV